MFILKAHEIDVVSYLPAQKGKPGDRGFTKDGLAIIMQILYSLRVFEFIPVFRNVLQ